MLRVPEFPGLVNELVQLLLAHREAFGQQRVFERVIALVFAEAVVWARHTVTQLLWALGIQEEDWSAWYRLFSQKRFNESAVNEVLLRETLRHVEAQGLYVIGGDGVQIWRDSKHMEGTGWLKCPRTPAWRPGSIGRNGSLTAVGFCQRRRATAGRYPYVFYRPLWRKRSERVMRRSRNGRQP